MLGSECAGRFACPICGGMIRLGEQIVQDEYGRVVRTRRDLAAMCVPCGRGWTLDQWRELHPYTPRLDVEPGPLWDV